MTLQSSKKWILPKEIPVELDDLYRGFSFFEKTILFNRNIVTKDEINDFFNLTASSIPNFEKLYDTERAAKTIKSAINENKKIYIHGDFDVDGVCASAIIWEFLYRELAKVIGKPIDITPYIPDRVDEGYGLSEKSVNAMLEKGAELIISVDCGIRDKSIIDKYSKERNLGFIITDHHQPPEDFLMNPESFEYPIVHQMHPSNPYPYDKICGAAVAFLFVQAIRSEFGIDSTITENTPGLDLVALATVTDLMPMLGVNRSFVNLGLSQINRGTRLGLKTLIDKSKLAVGNLDTYHLGYIIGPRLNAAGRMGSAMDALRLMVVDKQESADKLAYNLNKLNWERQQLTEETLNSAKEIIKQQQQDENKMIFVSGDTWQEGIIGLVAGKLLEEYNKPVITVSTKEAQPRGSARSIIGFNITDAIGNFSDYLVKYGGHAQAAGFTVKEGKLEELKTAIIDRANSIIDENMIEKTLSVDYVAGEDEPSFELLEKIDKFKPFGLGNRKPYIMIHSALVVEKKVIGQSQNHMKISFKGNTVGISEGVMFDCAEDIEKINIDDALDLVGYVDINEWNGNTTLQFMIKEWRKSE